METEGGCTWRRLEEEMDAEGGCKMEAFGRGKWTRREGANLNGGVWKRKMEGGNGWSSLKEGENSTHWEASGFEGEI